MRESLEFFAHIVLIKISKNKGDNVVFTYYCWVPEKRKKNSTQLKLYQQGSKNIFVKNFFFQQSVESFIK